MIPVSLNKSQNVFKTKHQNHVNAPFIWSLSSSQVIALLMNLDSKLSIIYNS